MVGIPGSGKSFFAQRFADMFSAPYVSFDSIQSIVDDAERTEAIIDVQLAELFKTKQSIVFEGSTATRGQRDELTRIAKAAGYKTLFIWVQTDTDSSVQRARKSGWTDEELEAYADHFSPPHEKEKAIVISGKHTFGTQLKIVLKKLSGPRAEESSSRPLTSTGRVFSDIRQSR